MAGRAFLLPGLPAALAAGAADNVETHSNAAEIVIDYPENGSIFSAGNHSPDLSLAHHREVIAAFDSFTAPTVTFQLPGSVSICHLRYRVLANHNRGQRRSAPT
jgi:hypothetical protein